MKRAVEVERRVYNLPTHLHQRLRAYMAGQKTENENQAVVGLLTDALLQRESAEEIVRWSNAALEAGKSASDVFGDLCQHPKAVHLEKDAGSKPPRWRRVTLTTGEVIRIENDRVSFEVVT
ncbi:hypothetical protein NFI95_05815 [Acetobacteraceae bacterium KSS8]|uniref:Uncharacterized protein n=1 Tax=Endosaccharibacter trunci TaxID=2812733 RepID=A0ABT1W503_9PROT|nr:hypothetical protein [Acetobacteraceae bacterium KSS8]